jgi:hypothetical protein
VNTAMNFRLAKLMWISVSEQFSTCQEELCVVQLHNYDIISSAENCALLSYAVCSGSYLPTFRDDIN